jgi:hypothetical protein
VDKFKHKMELECNHCKIRIHSEWEGHFNGHTCTKAGKVSKRYDHDKQEYEDWYPFMGVDETRHYTRLLGDPKHFTVIEV